MRELGRVLIGLGCLALVLGAALLLADRIPWLGPSDPSPPWAPAPEVRRRRREGWIIAGIIVAVTLLAIAQFRLPQSLGSGSLGTDAILIGLINVNLILLVLLVFLVGRNIAK